jgi:uncharacterized protein YnzC (UPF0291/DUF896 family)
MYPYYNTYSVFFGSTEVPSEVAVALKLTDYNIDPQSVLNALISILEEGRVESLATWRSQGLTNVDLNDVVEMRKAKLKSIAGTVVNPLEAIQQLIDKAGRVISQKPMRVVAPVTLAKFGEYVGTIEKNITKYQADLQASLKQPETYKALTPAQKQEVDNLEADLQRAKELAKKNKRDALLWYETEIPFYILGGVLFLYGGSLLLRSLK